MHLENFFSYKDDNLCGLLFLICINLVTADYNLHKGIYTEMISDYDVILPKQISSTGGELDIGNESHSYESRKRDVSGDGKLEVKIKLLGRDEILELWPSKGFLSDRLEIQRLGKQIISTGNVSTSSSKCHYRGTIRGRSDSYVAASVCRGLVAYMKISSREFWIEPSRNKTKSIKVTPHLVFRRSAVSQIYSKRKRKRKKRKKDRLCGTKEPQRIVKSRLKWNQRPNSFRVQGLGQRKKKINKKRDQRSVSKEHFVETLVVVDSSMIEFYQGEDVETYILSIMNMVNVMYTDPSIGNYINVVVVRIILLEDEMSQSLNIIVNADKTLDNFCHWQESINKADEKDPLHHDVALLITRQDICSGADTPCSTLGVAHVAGMCIPDRSCSVNEDNGITLAHTIAHEMGHNFGMYHDSAKLGCSGRKDSTLHVMTPTFEADTLNFAWSSCSRRDITNFLDGMGKCLEDKPTVQLHISYPELPVGAVYNAEYQCKLQFGTENTTICIPLEEICSKLWCVVDDTCTTMLQPAAPGTSCGKHRWCKQQQCMDMEDKIELPVDGGWGKWTEWSACSRTCGAGVSTSERLCNNPISSNGGKYCLGQRMRYIMCNTHDCPESAVSFRTQQCSSHNNKSADGKDVMWLSYFEATDPCQLYCIDKEDTTIMPMGVPTLDGTPCKLGTRDMCISGLCRRVGCDWQVDSTATEDKCGVCQGDGRQCTTIVSYYNKTYGIGYVKVRVIPKNAKNIVIEELGNSKNYIGVGSSLNGSFYLNGNKTITLPGEYIIAKSQALYTRVKEKENIHVLGPIEEDIFLYVIYQGNHKNLGIRFEYTIPLYNNSNTNSYDWKISDWSACSVTCGGGTQQAVPICNGKETGVADPSYCTRKKPVKKMRSCNLQPCTHRWWTGPWQLCPVSCGDLALRSRTVLCVSNEDRLTALPDSICADQPKPHHEEPCINTPSCLSTVYFLTDTATENYFIDRPKSKRLQFKNNLKKQQKNNWVVLPWSQCSVSCGLGFKKRTVYCGKASMCDSKSKPVEMKQCFKKCSRYKK